MKGVQASAYASASSSGGNNSIAKAQSISIVNGKKIVKTKIAENGVETETIEEDGVLISKKVNGVLQSIK